MIINMLVANYTNVRNDFKNFCDQVVETASPLIVTRKEDNNIVMLSLDQYNDIQKELRNAKYMAKLQRSYNQIAEDRGITRDLIEVDDE